MVDCLLCIKKKRQSLCRANVFCKCLTYKCVPYLIMIEAFMAKFYVPFVPFYDIQCILLKAFFIILDDAIKECHEKIRKLNLLIKLWASFR